MRVLSYGVGNDSTGILAAWHEEGLQETDPIDLILTADTGGERPRFYEYIEIVNEWLKERGFPEVTVVRKGGRQETLEENCLRLNMLPSLAYGFKGCSLKYKVEPQEKFLNNSPQAKAWWAQGQLVTKMIGYEHREERRWAKAKKFDSKYEYEFPLVERGWNKAECQAAIARVGLPPPGKSACFFCPASTIPEINELKTEHPLLFQRALIMEANAKLTSVKGLGRRFAWSSLTAHIAREDAFTVEVCRSCIDN